MFNTLIKEVKRSLVLCAAVNIGRIKSVEYSFKCDPGAHRRDKNCCIKCGP